MVFTFISVMGMIISSIVLLPDLVLTIRNAGRSFRLKRLVIVDYVLKYACLILMFLPLGVNKFGFDSVPMMLIYLGGNCLLLLVYLVFSFMVIKSPSIKYERVLCFLACGIYIISGFCINHILLIVCGIAYGYVHIKLLDGGLNE